MGFADGMMCAENRAFHEAETTFGCVDMHETAKAYMAHERGTLEAVTAARGTAMSSLAAAKANPGDPQAMKQLVSLRDRVTSAINQAIEKGFVVAQADLERATAQLDELNGQLDAVKEKVETLKTALEISAKIVSVAAAVVGFV